MNEHPEQSPAGDDSKLSAEYRAAATERVPPALDAIVLKEARAALGGGALKEFSTRWFRPLAFVATLALTLALLVEFTRAPEPDPDAMHRAPADDAAITTERSAAEISAPSPAAGGTDAPVTRLEPASEPVPEVSERASADFAKMLEDSAARMRETNTAADTVIQGLSQDTGRLEIETSRYCAEQETRNPENWWQCIEELKKTGHQAEAESEMRILVANHPEFEPPGSP